LKNKKDDKKAEKSLADIFASGKVENYNDELHKIDYFEDEHEFGRFLIGWGDRFL